MGLRRNAPAALALDLAAGRRRPGWLGWLLLALGALALAFELLDFAAARADLAERAAIVARLRAELRVNEAARGAGGATAEAERALEAPLLPAWHAEPWVQECNTERERLLRLLVDPAAVGFTRP